VIVALSVESREKVNQVINKAIESGGRESRNPKTMDGCMDVVLRTLMYIFGNNIHERKYCKK
jgi:predicted lactoylglutathione lyase